MIIKIKNHAPVSIPKMVVVETIRRAIARNAEVITFRNEKNYFRLGIFGKFTNKQKAEIKEYVC